VQLHPALFRLLLPREPDPDADTDDSHDNGAHGNKDASLSPGTEPGAT
jgi:hypothetical protein